MIFRLVLLFLVSNFAMATEFVRVRSHVVAKPESEVTLSQLLDLAGVSERLKTKSQSIVVSVAPKAGERLEVSNAAVTSLLRPVIAQERGQGLSEVKVLIPNKVVIDTVRRSIEEEEVKEELTTSWRPLCEDCDIEIQNLSLPRVDNILDWTLKLEAKLPKGSFAVPVEIVRENQATLLAWINGSVKIKKRVPVVKRMMQAGERILAADIGYERIDVTHALDGSPTFNDIVGKKLKMSLRVNDPIWASFLEQEKAVKRGDLVRVSSSAGIWEVAMSLTAQSDATVGETVSLKNPRTNKLLTGTVVAQGEVELK